MQTGEGSTCGTDGCRLLSLCPRTSLPRDPRCNLSKSVLMGSLPLTLTKRDAASLPGSLLPTWQGSGQGEAGKHQGCSPEAKQFHWKASPASSVLNASGKDKNVFSLHFFFHRSSVRVTSFPKAALTGLSCGKRQISHKHETAQLTDCLGPLFQSGSPPEVQFSTHTTHTKH